MMTDEQAARVLIRRECKQWQKGGHVVCRCAEGECDHYSRAQTTEWSATAAAIGAPLPALAALATREAVVVPTDAPMSMFYKLDDADRNYPRDGGTLLGKWREMWAAALAASPFKREGE